MASGYMKYHLIVIFLLIEIGIYLGSIMYSEQICFECKIFFFFLGGTNNSALLITVLLKILFSFPFL